LNGVAQSQKVRVDPFHQLLLKNPFFNKSIRSEVIKEALKENCRFEKLPSREYSICSTSENSAFDFNEEWQVPEGYVFVAGDFRSEILDLKRIKPYGLVPFKNIKAKASTIVLSLDRPDETKTNALTRLKKERILRRIN
jgi:hypothetical protein